MRSRLFSLGSEVFTGVLNNSDIFLLLLALLVIME